MIITSSALVINWLKRIYNEENDRQGFACAPYLLRLASGFWDLPEKTHIMGEPELEVSTRAFCKMIMHSAKYPRFLDLAFTIFICFLVPSSSINGVLLSKRDSVKTGAR